MTPNLDILQRLGYDPEKCGLKLRAVYPNPGIIKISDINSTQIVERGKVGSLWFQRPRIKETAQDFKWQFMPHVSKWGGYRKTNHKHVAMLSYLIHLNALPNRGK